MSKRKSHAWDSFKKLNSDEAECNICEAILCCKGGNTTAMLNHLKIHNINIRKNAELQETTAKKVKTTSSSSSVITKFIQRESLNEILAKCAAKDGFSFRGIAKSEAIRGYVSSRNYNMPRSPTTIQNCIMEFYEQKKEESKKELATLLGLNNKLSITVDEWTDILMRRFLNTTLHSTSGQFVLGLTPIQEKCTAEKTEELVRKQLCEYILITAEGTLVYLFQKLKDVNTSLSLLLSEALKVEIINRRNKEIMSLLLFLHHGCHPKANEFLNYHQNS